MRSLHPMTNEEREFAEQKHQIVLDFLRCKRLPMDDYYDIVIFGYLSAVQQYFRSPPADVTFKTMAFRAMKDSILREGEYNARAKRRSFTVSLDGMGSYGALPDPWQDTERQIEEKTLLEQARSIATKKEAKILRLLVDGLALNEAARFLRMPKTAAVTCMENFCCRARAIIG